jgi:hypothetical protein
MRNGLRKISYFTILAMGLLAMMNVESPENVAQGQWRRTDIRQRNSFTRMYQAAVSATGLSKSSMAKKLKEVMNSDELGVGNPYENLSSDDSLKNILQSKVTAFERKTMRSPAYHDESGYDMVHYEILHDSGEISTILAYVEADTNESSEGQPELHEENVVLVVLTSQGEKNQYALYRNGTLEEVREIMPEEGQSMIAQRMATGIPFLSVSR